MKWIVVCLAVWLGACSDDTELAPDPDAGGGPADMMDANPADRDMVPADQGDVFRADQNEDLTPPPSASHVAVVSDDVVITAGGRFLSTWSVENGDRFVFRDDLFLENVEGSITNVRALDRLAIVWAGRSRFEVIDVSAIEKAEPVSFIAVHDGCDTSDQMTLVGNRVFLTCRNGIGVADFSNPRQPSWLGIQLPWESGAAYRDQAHFAGDTEYAGLVLHVGDTGEMSEIGPVAIFRMYRMETAPLGRGGYVEFESPLIRGLLADGKYFYAWRDDAFLVFDMTEPQPALIATVPYEQERRFGRLVLAVGSGQLFITIDRGLEIHDVRNPGNSDFRCYVSTDELNQTVARVRVFGNDLYIVGARDRGALEPLRKITMGSTAEDTCAILKNL